MVTFLPYAHARVPRGYILVVGVVDVGCPAQCKRAWLAMAIMTMALFDDEHVMSVISKLLIPTGLESTE